MKARAGEVLRGTAETVRRAAIAADQTVVLATPVDTGRARANWITSIGSPVLRATEGTDPSGASTISEGRQVIGSWKVGAGPIYIANSVPYIIPLDEGSSAQAPNGMSGLAVQAARSQLVRAKILGD
jgi:hypothetical protein